MSYFLHHLHTGWHVDQAILSEDDRIVVIRFGRENEPQCMVMDETLFRILERVKNFAVIYLVNIDEVPDFNQMYELDHDTNEPYNIMFFWRNKHMMVDYGTGDNNKLNFPIDDEQEVIDIIETIYRGATKGKGLVVSPRDYLTRRRA